MYVANPSRHLSLGYSERYWLTVKNKIGGPDFKVGDKVFGLAYGGAVSMGSHLRTVK